MNLQYWLPRADIFVRPAESGLEITLIGTEINWKARMVLIKEEDEGLPDLV